MVMPLIRHKPDRECHDIQIGHLRPLAAGNAGDDFGRIAFESSLQVHMLSPIDEFLGGFLAYPVRRTARLLELS